MRETARVASWAMLAGCIVLAVACRKARHSQPHSRALPPLPEASGCGHAGARTGDFALQALDGDGMTRDYEVLVPAGPGPFALTFVFHGSGSTQAAAKAFGLQSAPGAGASSIFVFPQGMPFRSYGVGWDDACDGYDMAFFDAMLSRVEADYCVDKNAIFASGFSWGCDFVTSLSCCRGDRIRAVAGGSCSDEFADPAKASTYLNLPCPAPRHPAMRFTYDPNGDQAFTAQYFATTSVLYRELNACPAGAAGKPTDDPACVSYEGCASPFLECRYAGMGHALPANWAAETWRFFSSSR